MNDAYRVVPYAHVNYFADAKWWHWQKDRDEFKAFAGEKCTIFSTGNMCGDPEIHMLRNAERSGVSVDPEFICTGFNSGYQAVNIASLAGAARIVLLGYDAKSGANGKRHFFGEHPDRTEAPYSNMVSAFREMVKPMQALGIQMINATRGSAIKAFPFATLSEAIDRAL